MGIASDKRRARLARTVPAVQVPGIARAPHALVEGCTVMFNVGANHRTFIRTPAGEVLVSGSGLDLARSHGANDDERRAYCKLSGHSFAALKAQMRAEKQRTQAADKRRALHRLEADAKRLGMVVRKPRAAKVPT